MNRNSYRRIPALLAVAAVTLAAGCGGSSHSAGDIAAKLKQEPTFVELKKVLAGDKYDKAIDCIAQYLKDKGKGADIDSWLSGKMPLEQVKGSDSESNASATAAKCVKDQIK